MFGRRNPLSYLQRLKLLFLPQGGWRRCGSYIVHRLKRLPGTPARIAAGFACGAAVSFTPFVGFHFLLAAGMAMLIRGNVLASAFGTIVGNPWTFAFIWIWTYEIGVWIVGSNGADLPDSISFSYIFDHPMRVLWPMFVGSLPTGLLVWLATFFPVRLVVEQYQVRRRRRLARRKAKQKRKWRALPGRVSP